MEQKFKVIKEMESGKDHKFADMAFEDLLLPDCKTREETLSTAKDVQNPSWRQKKVSKKRTLLLLSTPDWDSKMTRMLGLNGPILKLKAQHLVAKMGHDFIPSDGWLSHFKERYTLHSNVRKGRSNAQTSSQAKNG